MKKKVLITRPRDQAEEFAAMVAVCGAKPFFAPLLDVQKISYDIRKLPETEALVITSHNALPEDFPDIWAHRSIYCVGDATEVLCRRKGAQGNILVAQDVAHLILILTHATHSSFLYLRGAEISENIAARLTHKDWHEVITYRANMIKVLPPEILDIFSSLDIITFFSGRTAAAFSAIVAGTSLRAHLAHMTALSLSQKGIDSVEYLGWKHVAVALTPDMNGMVQALKRLTG